MVICRRYGDCPPDGDMSDYLHTLCRLVETPIDAIAPAHRRVLESPQQYLRPLILYRRGREQKVIDGLT